MMISNSEKKNQFLFEVKILFLQIDTFSNNVEISLNEHSVNDDKC